jgi:3-dehydroquinate synthase
VKKIRLYLGPRSYNILVGRGLIKDCGRLIKKLRIGKDAVVITNRAIHGLYKRNLKESLENAGLRARFELVPDSEKAKSLKILTSLLCRLAAADKASSVFIIALGGGVVGDLAGFVASVYKRGIPYVQIPTTLLSQVDSAIGGKVAVDLPAAKNLAGAFYQPKLVISDTSFLTTLSRRQIASGLAEIIKYAVIGDANLFSYLERNYRKIFNGHPGALEHIISRCASIKARIVERDEFDKKNLRIALNYGHTIGHALEAASGYAGSYNHGEAVAIGIAAANRIAVRLGFFKGTAADRVERLIKNCSLPTKIKRLKVDQIYRALMHDKKFIHGKNRFVLPVRIGKIRVFEGLPPKMVKDAIRECM